MPENLITTHYRNDTAIVYPGSNNTAWETDNTGTYAWYKNDIGWKDSYDVIYNCCAVADSIGLCPAGWHIPTDNNWIRLTDNITGGVSNGGNQLKSCPQVGSPLGGD